MSVDEIYAAYCDGKLTTVQVKQRLSQMACGVQPPSTESWFPLAETQRGLWFLEQAAAGMSAYNVPIAIQLPVALDEGVLVSACRRLLAHYPILTTIIADHDGELRQTQRSAWVPPIHREDVSHLDAEELLGYLKRLVKQPFSMSEALLRIYLLRRSASQTIVVFNVHHVIFDGRSILPLVRTFMRSYRNVLEGVRDESAAASFSYRSFVEAERKFLASSDAARRLSFWREQLNDHTGVLQLPTDRPRPPHPAFQGETFRYRLSAELTARLRELSRSSTVYPSTLFLGVYQMLLAKYSGAKDIIVGMPVDSRMLVTQPAAVGLFANMIPIRSVCEDSAKFGEFLKTLQLTLINGIANAYPFAALVRELGIAPSASNAPLFQVSYTYQGSASDHGADDAGRATAEFDVEFIEGVSQEGEYELGLEIYDRQREFGLNLKYDPSVFDAATIEKMLERYVALLHSVAKNPGHCLGNYSLLSDAERTTLLIDWNATRIERAGKQCIFELFEQQARRTPQSVAIRSQDRTVTYAQLQ